MAFSETVQRLSRLVLMSSAGLRYALARRGYDRSSERQRVQGLLDTWQDCPALIVGNGPSLNRTPLDEFIDIPSIGMNKIDLIYPRLKWRPSIVLCTNNLVAAQNQDAWAQAGVPVYLSWKCRRLIRRELRREFSYFLSMATREFSLDAAHGVGSAGTVTYAALQFAYYMGANPVIIVGVDHSFAGAREGKENLIEKRSGPDADHFDPNYFRDGQHWGIPNLPLSEHGYLLARQAFESAGRRVYDATIGGKLSVFEKLGIEDTIRLAHSSRSVNH